MTLLSRACSKSTITRVWKWSCQICLLSQKVNFWTPWQSSGIGEVFKKLRHCWKKDGMTLLSRACSKSTITRVWKWSCQICLLSQKVKLWTPWQSSGIGEVFKKLRHCWKKDGMTLLSRACSKSTITRVWKWSCQIYLLLQGAKSWTPWQNTGIGEVFKRLRHCWKKDGMTLLSRACSKSTITRVWKRSCQIYLLSQAAKSWTPWQSTGIGKIFKNLRRCWKKGGMTQQSTAWRATTTFLECRRWCQSYPLTLLANWLTASQRTWITRVLWRLQSCWSKAGMHQHSAVSWRTSTILEWRSWCQNSLLRLHCLACGTSIWWIQVMLSDLMHCGLWASTLSAKKQSEVQWSCHKHDVCNSLLWPRLTVLGIAPPQCHYKNNSAPIRPATWFIPAHQERRHMGWGLGFKFGPHT